MGEPRSLDELAAELERLEAEQRRIGRELAGVRRELEARKMERAGDFPSAAPVEITETDRAAARARARRLGLVVREPRERRR